MTDLDLKIVFISEYFPPEIGAGSNRVYELCKQWVDSGVKVTVITGFPDYPTGRIPPEYKGLKFLREVKEGIEVIRTFTIPAPNKGFFLRVVSFISFMLSGIIQGSWASGKQDIVIATSPPFFVGISGYIISKIKRVPFVFEVRDLWPESIVQLGQLKNKLIITILEKIEYFLYRNCSHIVSVADSTVQVLVSNGISKEKIDVIKNGADLNLFLPQNKNKDLFSSLDISNKFVVAYIGTIGLSHDIDKVLDTANLLRNNNEIVFLIIGEGAEKGNLLRKQKELNLNNVIFLDNVDKMLLPDYYSICDILLVSLKKLPLFEKVIPSKIFEIFAMRKPIIINVDGEARKIVEDSGGGIFVEPGNEVALKNCILFLYERPHLLESMGEKGRKFIEANFNRKVLANTYLELLKSIVKN